MSPKALSREICTRCKRLKEWVEAPCVNDGITKEKHNWEPFIN